MEIGTNIPNMAPVAPPSSAPKGGDVDARIKQLEKRLEQLSKEKENAIGEKNEKKAKEIQKQIEEIQKQIQQLRQRQNKNQEPVSNSSVSKNPTESDHYVKDPSLGNYIDETV